MWFKKKKEVVLATLGISEPTISRAEFIVSKYPKEVIEIHHEFHTAADRLVNEANSILKEAESKDANKVSRLEALGFKQAGQVVELKPLLQKANLSKEQLELLAYYQREYPLNKFITEEQVKTICHKYNLVCGEVNRFKGFVPNKNLNDIEKFKVKDVDSIKYFVNSKKGLFYINESDIHPDILNYLNSVGDVFCKFSDRSYDNIKGGNEKFGEFAKCEKVKGNLLKICAPVKDMDISGLELVEGYKLEKKHIPDPVVLQPVKGGYLIVTAWGDEGSDELVVNNKMN